MFKENVSLKQYSSYKIGGSARYFFDAQNINDFKKAIAKAKKDALPIFVLAGGTNLLISDKGYDGLVIKANIQHIEPVGKNIVRVGAGSSVLQFLSFLVDNSLSGMEWAGGLPGSVGGAIRGNAGAFGGEIKDNIKSVTSLDCSSKTSKIIKRNKEECRFAYRDSVFKKSGGNEIVLEAEFEFSLGDKEKIKEAIEDKIKYRKERHPMEYPNIGSVFKNVDVEHFSKSVLKQFEDKIKNDPMPVVPTAVLIAKSNLKGVSFGGAMISPKHPNFIVNVLGATASDVAHLIELVKKEVHKNFKVILEEEIVRV